MTFLRSKGLPVPMIYGYSASPENPAGTEYIFMEFSPGRELATVWSDMNEHDQLRFVKNLVDLERRIFNLRLPASGSLYFQRDLLNMERKIAVDPEDAGQAESFFIGPSTSLDLWFGKRSGLSTDRGPFIDIETVLNAGAKKERLYLERFGRPLLPFDRMRREDFHLEKQQPSIYLDSLRKYLQISGSLIPRTSSGILHPIIRHPDLRPSNIFVSTDYKILSIIDWQHSTILPLFLHSGIPEDLDNSKDPVSRSLERPHLPEEFPKLSEDERSQQLDLFSKRHRHYLYMTETATKNLIHFEAMTHPFSIGRRKIYQLSAAPWHGDNIPLRSSLMFVKQQWPQIAARPNVPCPITFAEEEIHECLRLDQLEQEAVSQLEASKEMLGLGPEGWVSNDNYAAAKEAISRMKAMCLEQAESDFERTVIMDHWVYDDMDEDEYL